MVCCAEQLQLPADDWVRQGHVWRAEALGQWLRRYVQQGDYDVEGMYVCLDDACISQHTITLAADLSDDDVTFQVLAEMQAVLGMPAADVSVDFGWEPSNEVTTPETGARTRVYRVAAVPRFRVDAFQRVAKAAHIELCAVEGRHEAVRRTQTTDTLATLPAVGVAMALQYEAAFGLALGAWGSRAFNFLPYRALADAALRHTWWLGVVAYVVGGAFVAIGFALSMTASTSAIQESLNHRAAIERAYQAAQMDHAQAQAEQQQRAQHMQSLQTQRSLHVQTVQWVRALDERSQGIWVTRVEQQDSRWRVHGEALSFAHATQMVQHLTALTIWTKPPALVQLQMKSAPLATGLPVWQFRIEAELKGAV
jgi:hypothetical protein